MPAIPHGQFVDVILDAINQSGYVGVFTSALRTHPRRFTVAGPDGDLSLWVYGWTLTPGGRPQLMNEYRVQMTSVDSPLLINPHGSTVLIGCEPDLGMFAGFDLEQHRVFTAGSPSVQIDVTVLQDALQDGLAFHRKENNEIAIGIRPDQFMTYVHHALTLHSYGRNRRTLNLLRRAATRRAIPVADLDAISVPRRRIVETVSRMSRAANFREQVLNAYGNRCAITRMQLRLVDAAHILPVTAPGSVDHVRNGIALSPTYHRAFDHGLIYLNDNYHMRINRERESDLLRMEMADGLEGFRSPLGKIHLPPNREWWPDTKIIRKANRCRRIASR